MHAKMIIDRKKKPGKHITPCLKTDEQITWYELSDNIWPEINISVMLTTIHRGGTEANTTYSLIVDAKLKMLSSGEIDGFYIKDNDGCYIIPIYIDDIVAWSYDTIDIDAFCYKEVR